MVKIRFGSKRSAVLGTIALALLGGSAHAMTLQEAVQLTVSTNPEIGEARASRLAIDHELTQARGLYLPQIDLRAEVGPEYTDSPTVRSRNDFDGDTAWPRWNLSVVLQQRIFDGFETDSEVERQAARVDAAAYRVLERSEFVGLDVVQAYLDVMRNMELVNLARDNVDVHRGTLGEVQRLVNAGEASVADSQQAEARLRNAEETLISFEADLEEGRINYQTIVGQMPGQLTMPAPVITAVPLDLETAVHSALSNNPLISIALADLDVSHAELREAEAVFYPSLTLEGTASHGFNIAGQQGDETRANLLLVARYNLYRGGIDSANRQEQIAHIGERQERLDRIRREVEELVRSSWNTMDSITRRIPVLEQEVVAGEQVRQSYREQFVLGARTLIDVLDSENELFNSRVALSSAQFAQIFSRYRVIAATGNLMNTLNIRVPDEAAAVAREGAGGVHPAHVSELPLGNDYFR
ncbi:MAG: TolC family outer membrane protein [Rhodospirillaceae bacterium]|nr:TolC family outer membrane protein [Rhodospirillaceae bacterium]